MDNTEEKIKDKLKQFSLRANFFDYEGQAKEIMEIIKEEKAKTKQQIAREIWEVMSKRCIHNVFTELSTMPINKDTACEITKDKCTPETCPIIQAYLKEEK